MTSSWLPSSFMPWMRKETCGAWSSRKRGRAQRYRTGLQVHAFARLCPIWTYFSQINLPQQNYSLTCGLLFQKLPAQNPILKNITDYLIEEVSAEEEELLGSGSGMDPEENAKEGNPAETTVERDDKLAKVWLLQLWVQLWIYMQHNSLSKQGVTLHLSIHHPFWKIIVGCILDVLCLSFRYLAKTG